jgi:hypothetical protein
MFIVLESVATAIDDQTLITYAMYQSGDIDENSGVPLGLCSEEWYNSLSKEDREMVEHLKDTKKYLR